VVCRTEGTIVCPDCALVLSDVLYVENNPKPPNELFTDRIHFWLRDVCANGNISAYIEQKIYMRFKKLCIAIERQSTRKYSEKQIMAYAIYETLSSFTPKSPEEIFVLTGVPQSILWNIESCFSSANVEHITDGYLQRFSSLLNISWKHRMNLALALSRIGDSGGVTTRCLTAALIREYIVINKMKIKMSDICRICNVSPTTIRKIASRLNIAKYIY
jgi:hypothetical protein